MLEVFRLVWEIVKFIFAIWIVYKLVQIAYFWFSASPAKKAKVKVLWYENDSVSDFIKAFNKLINPPYEGREDERILS